jgi:hypothetical protein
VPACHRPRDLCELSEAAVERLRMVSADQPGCDDVQQLDHQDVASGLAQRLDDQVELAGELVRREGRLQRVIAVNDVICPREVGVTVVRFPDSLGDAVASTTRRRHGAPPSSAASA